MNTNAHPKPFINTCGDKVVYPSKKRAMNKAALSRQRDRNSTRGPIRPYRCQLASHWHLGHWNDRVENLPPRLPVAWSLSSQAAQIGRLVNQLWKAVTEIRTEVG